MTKGYGPEWFLQGILGEAELKAVSGKKHWPLEKEDTSSDLTFSSTSSRMVNPPGVPVASPQAMILGCMNFSSYS